MIQRLAYHPKKGSVVCLFTGGMLAAMVAVEGSEESGPAWRGSTAVSRDEFWDRDTGVRHRMTADRSNSSRAPSVLKIEWSCYLKSNAAGEFLPAEPELVFDFPVRGRRWDYFTDGIELRRPKNPSSPTFETWLEIRVDSKPPIRLDANARLGTVTHRPSANDTVLLEYMKGGDSMRARVAGDNLSVGVVGITGAERAYAMIKRACADKTGQGF